MMTIQLKNNLKIRLGKRQKIFDICQDKFISAAMDKEYAFFQLQKVKTELEELDRAAFEAAQGSKAAPTGSAGKGGLAASIEKVFGTQGLELVQAAQQRFEELSKEPSD